MQEFIDSLNLPFEGEMRNNEYIININNSDDFSKLFSSISLNSELSLIDNSLATDEESRFRYTDGEYELLLQANYKDDIYSLVIGVR